MSQGPAKYEIDFFRVGEKYNLRYLQHGGKWFGNPLGTGNFYFEEEMAALQGEMSTMSNSVMETEDPLIFDVIRNLKFGMIRILKFAMVCIHKFSTIRILKLGMIRFPHGFCIQK